MSKVFDRRNKSMGGNDKRSLSQIKNIAVHYSATSEGDTTSFERFWKSNHGWNTGGYHEVVLLNGDVELNYSADTISNGVGGQNTRMYNICYVGAGVPNAKQLATLKERVNYNRKRLNVSVANVKGHREYQGQSTSCPALNMGDFRKSLSGVSSTTTKPSGKPTSKPKPTAKPKGDATIREIQTKVNRYHGISIAVDGLKGPDTKKAVVNAYQQELRVQFGANIVADGIPGPKTDKAAVTIRYNKSKGDLAYLVQAMLYLQGINVKVDGYFQDDSIKAVKQFQRKHKLTADGIPGKASFKKLIRM